MVKSVVTEALTNISPVFSFYMGVVIFMIESGTGEHHRMFSMMGLSFQVPIHEFRAIITIETLDGEG